MPFIPANAIEGAITIAVLVIAFIGWLVQMAGQAKGPQPPVNRPRPAMPAGNRPEVRRDKSLQSEIDAFLREVGSSRKPAPKDVDDDIEILEDDEAVTATRRSPSSFDRVQPAPPVMAELKPPVTGTPSAWDLEHQRRRERLVSTVAERHLESAPLGAEMRKHVDEYMAESERLRREKEKIERSLADARAELREMRGVALASPIGQAGGVRGGGRSAVVGLLKDKRTVKDAIIINEILSKPRALRARER